MLFTFYEKGVVSSFKANRSDEIGSLPLFDESERLSCWSVPARARTGPSLM